MSAEISEAKDMLESLCQQARNRMREFGVPQATFHVVDCPHHKESLHIEVRNGSYTVGDFHVWSRGDSKQPSLYEKFFMTICYGIRAAEDMIEYIRHCEEHSFEMFGLAPDHGGYLN